MDLLLSNVNKSDNMSQGRTYRRDFRRDYCRDDCRDVAVTHEKLAASSMLPVPL